MRGKGWHGFKKGMGPAWEAVMSIADSMLADGFDRATVMKLTGLSADDLAQIRH